MTSQQTARIGASYRAPLDLTAHQCPRCQEAQRRATLAEENADYWELRYDLLAREATGLRRQVASLRRDTPRWYETALATVAALWARLGTTERLALGVVGAALLGALVRGVA